MKLVVPRLALIFIASALIGVFARPSVVHAQAPNPLVQALVQADLDMERLGQDRRMGRLTPTDFQAQYNALQNQHRALGNQLAALPPEQRAQVLQQEKILFSTEIVPLRQQWADELQQKQGTDQAKARQIDSQIQGDADKAGHLQAGRILLREKLAHGEITPEVFAADDKLVETDLLALEKKYFGYGQGYGTTFSNLVASTAARVVLEARQKNAATIVSPETASAPSQEATTAANALVPLTSVAASSATQANLTDPNADWTSRAPSVAQVLAEIKGSDPTDTAARQEAAFSILRAVVMAWSGQVDNGMMSPRAKTLFDEYSAAAVQARDRFNDPIAGNCSGMTCASAQINRVALKYNADSNFAQDLLSRWFPAERVKAVMIKYYPGSTTALISDVEGSSSIGALISRGLSIMAYVVIFCLVAFATWWQTRNIAPAILLGVVALGIWWLREDGDLIWAVGALCVAAFIVWSVATAKSRADKRQTKRTGWSNKKVWSSIPGTPEERAVNIDKIFDLRNQSLSLLVAGPATGRNRFLEEYFAPVSSFSPKEREALRSAYHLYNLDMMPESNFYTARAAIILGSKKGIRNKDYKGFSSNSGSYHPLGLEAGIALVMNDLLRNVKKNPDHPILRKLSARLYGDGGDLVPGAPLQPGVRGEATEASLILGLDEKVPDKLWCYDGEGSLITIAPPGSGKTQCQVFPNLLTWKGAAVVLDVKGEIYEQTSKWRQQNVGPVYKFSPLDPAASHSYNPLTLVRADPDYLWEDSRFLADMMIVPSGAKDPFWESRARDVLTAAIARVCDEAHGDGKVPSMADVLDILHGVGWREFVSYLVNRDSIRSMVRAGHSLAGMEAKTRDGVLQSALSSMSAWDGDRIARVMNRSDWNPLDLRGDKNPTIYICLKPNEVDSYISLLRVFIAQHIRTLTAAKLPSHGTHPILFVLDELPRLRHMPPIEEALEVGRQYGIKLWMFAQSLGQLKNAYPNADGMIGSCSIRMFMNPSLHDETAQKVSDDIGFQESVVDGTRVKIIEPNVLAGPEYKDFVIVMASNAKAARLKKNFAYADATLTARMGSV